jgi:hypothetical protein
MKSINHGSFIAPSPKPRYEDGRHRCDASLKKMFARGPQRPSEHSLAKRVWFDADVNAVAAATQSDGERRLRSNAHEALDAVKKIHRTGRRPGLPGHEAVGDAPFASKSIGAVRKAQGRALHVDGRMLSPRELNKAFATTLTNPSLSARDLAKMVRKGAAQSMRPLDPINDHLDRGPNSSNAVWNDVHADTGASNDWRDQPTPSVEPTIVGAQTLVTPSALTRDAAVDAIKRALRQPKKAFGNSDSDDDGDDDQDQTSDLDEDEADEDEDDSDAKDPNSADAFDNSSKKRGKRRANRDEE